jgi:hypothetical protein
VKHLGKAVILTFAEYESLMCRTEDAEAHAADFAEELSRMRANNVLVEARRRQERKAAFTAGKFHAAGGYAHALMLTRKEVSQARLLLARWRPLAWALETTPGQFTGDDSDSSDIHAAADFFIIGQHVAQERSHVNSECRQMTPVEKEVQHKMVDDFTKGIDHAMIEAINFRPQVKP